ncbi:unnamed protein product [Meganyctiphanes norvegica]|uniref:Uncharacterized protein n=1 Tax=Meganyctiphanes norvegica TaxID=48144 RepID=A0AAV2PQZ5_MEGNR
MQILLLALPLVLLSASSVCGQNLIPQVSQQDLQKWVATPQAAAKLVGCAIQYQPQCDPRARAIGGLMPALIKANFQCRPHCSANGQRTVNFLVNALRTRYNDQWQRLGTHFTQRQGGGSNSGSSSGSSNAVPEASTAELRKWLASPAAAERTITCIINYRPDCDPRAQTLARALPALVRGNLQCNPPQCSASTQEKITLFLVTLRETYPDQLRRLQQHIEG